MKRNIVVAVLEMLVFLTIMFSSGAVIFSNENILAKSLSLCLLLIAFAFLKITITDTFSDRVLIFFRTK